MDALIEKGLLARAGKDLTRKIRGALPSHALLRHTLSGQRVVPFLVIDGINVTCHNTMNRDGKLAISVCMDRDMTKRVDGMLQASLRAAQPVVIFIFSQLGNFVGHVSLAHVRRTALFWRLQLEPLRGAARIRPLAEILVKLDEHVQALSVLKGAISGTAAMP